MANDAAYMSILRFTVESHSNAILFPTKIDTPIHTVFADSTDFVTFPSKSASTFLCRKNSVQRPKRVKSNYWANTNYIEKSNKQRISNLLQNETDHKKNGLLVTGALGSGKTAFLTELCYPGCGGNFSRSYTKIRNEKSGQNRLGPFSILCIINSPQLRGTALGVWDPYSNLFRFFTISRTFFNDQFSK